MRLMHWTFAAYYSEAGDALKMRRAPSPGERPRSGGGYFARLTNVPYKRFVEIGEGTHSIIIEKNRMRLFREVMEFLREAEPQSLN
jgi:hypothetical protein